MTHATPPLTTPMNDAASAGTASWKSLMIRAGISVMATAGLIALGFVVRSFGTTDYETPRWAIIIHLATVIPGLPLGAWVLWSKKGTVAHKMAGRVWGLMMLVTAIDSFWIRSLTGSIGPIHLFSVLTLVSIPLGVWHIRNGNVRGHERAMRGVYIGLVTAGAFSMIPGRLMGSVIFG